ncbi:MAG: tetratricopeptide repeat protein, partial [Gemmatimonadota bacterium]|nr:tetratricopeptide repeat protein [Gemmatimonadota bacterium]
LDPLDPAIPTNMGYIRKKQGRLDEAAAFYHRSLAVDSTSFNSLNSLGNIYARNGEDSLAAAYYLKAREYRPGNYMAATNLATLYRRLGRREEAERLMQGIENTILPEPVVLLKRGAVFLEEGLLDSAALRFKRALSLDSDLVTAEARLGEVYLRQDSLDLAVRHLRHVLVEGVPGWPLYNNMAIAYERLGRADSAAFFFRKAYETQPDSSSSTLKLAVALKSMDSTNVAVAMVKRLLETDFRNAPAHYNLGNWLVELGKYGEAAVHYQEALNINPKDVKTHLNLGLTYLQFLDSPEKALELLEECLRLDPHQAQAGRIRQTVEYLKARLR